MPQLHEEDIFSIDSIEIVIRFGEHAITTLDKQNKYTFEYIKQQINNLETQCYFLKQNDTEHRIIIPLLEISGQFEIIVVWQSTTFSYEAKVNKKKKTRYNEAAELPTEYHIEERCKVKIINTDEPYRTKEDLERLKNRIDKLEIAPKTQIENQREIWTKYITAQELIIRKLQEPFQCTGKYDISEIKNNNGDVSRFKFKINLIAEQNDEYKIFEDELQKLDSNEKFNIDGTIFLKLDDINRGLDSIIQQRFKEIFEREKNIGCILKIRPFSLVQKIQSYFPNATFKKNTDRRQIFVSNYNDSPENLIQVLSNYSFKYSRVSIDFTISNIEDLVYNNSFNQKNNISFGRKFLKKENEPEIVLPEPINRNTFRLMKPLELFDEFQFFKNSLIRIYGKENLKICNFTYVFDPIESEKIKFFDDNFTSEYWTDIKRDLYLIGYDITISEADQNLYFEFSNRDELVEKYEALKQLNRFDILKSPLDGDFKFKVKTNLIAKRTNKQVFQERLEKLRGVEFVYNNAKKDDKRNDFVFIGKLSSQESTLNQLVFNIPYYFKDEKKIAKEFLKFIENKPEIKAVQANLKGDEAKTKWLREAMDKLKEQNQNSEKPNSKPINPKIRDFIFDSSKAEPVFKFDFNKIEETEEYKTFPKYEILKLNESQRKSILRALYAKDLCLLQGPPGTGKTTVIAELIWQLIRQNQISRILLTSETNLAVDNALEKLMNIKNVNPELANFITLIKPLRFGKSNKFEEEGKKYSIERITKWLNEEYETEIDYENEQLTEEVEEEEILLDNPNNNIIQNWMIRIADRSQSSNPKYLSILKDWVIELSQPSKDTKHYFKEKYFKYTNVIGSTCSSTGSPAFSRDYQSIYNPNANKDSFKKINELQFLMVERAQSRKIYQLIDELGIDLENPTENNFESLKAVINNILNIRYDTVIMDEASKATPPDLLLPLCFGKKSIVIGDHRQLPPLLNEKDFKETLLDLVDSRGNTEERALKLLEEIDRDFVETSQFKRLILNPKVSNTIKSTFDVQYRMHPHINNVIKQFYLDDECGGLKCGLDSAKVDLPDLNETQSRYHGFFHDGFINENVHTIWVNVDEPEMQDGTSRVNEMEVEAIKQVLTYLKHATGFEEYMKHWDKIKDEEKRLQEKEIGIISFYGKQVSKLKEARTTAKQLDIPIRLKTVDKFQGMERNIIIVSTVRSDKLNKGNNVIVPNSDIGFAKAPERLNVALSRARRLLIVVGNKNFFYRFKDKEGNPIYKNAIDEIAKTGRIIEFKSLEKYSNK